MVVIVKEFLELLEQYFVYIYPGFVTIFIHQFAKAEKTKLNKSTLGISVVISYLYILLYKLCFMTPVSEFSNLDYIILLVASIIFPIILHWVSKSYFVEKALYKLGLNTTIEDTVWGYIQNRDKEKTGIVMKVFLDGKGIMYEGCLRYISNPEKQQAICLSGYRRYVKVNGEYILKKNYENDNSRWVLMYLNEMDHIEIKYKSAK